MLFRYTIHLGVSFKGIAGELKSVTDEKTAPSTDQPCSPGAPWKKYSMQKN